VANIFFILATEDINDNRDISKSSNILYTTVHIEEFTAR
jgi:hypothetical protein